MNAIKYKVNARVRAAEVAELFKNAGLNRPVDDVKRIQQMLDHANLTITAWRGMELVGIARSLTDFCYCCYLSDLAVKKDLQKQGIGKILIELTKEQVGDQAMLLLLSAPPAMDYYPKAGFEKVENGFIIKRTK